MGTGVPRPDTRLPSGVTRLGKAACAIQIPSKHVSTMSRGKTRSVNQGKGRAKPPTARATTGVRASTRQGAEDQGHDRDCSDNDNRSVPAHDGPAHGLDRNDGVGALDNNANVEDANAYIDSVLEFELPKHTAKLDPLKARNFQPVNGHHLNGTNMRFVFFSVTGLRDISRDGDCQLTRANEEHPTTLECNLATELRYDVVAELTYPNATLRKVKINGTFEGVRGPLTVTFERSLPAKVEFSPRYDAMWDSVSAGRKARPTWYAVMERELHLQMMNVFEYATKRVFAKAMLNAAKEVPFPE
ncbi:hypothetical protein HPB51_020653 [Rhipicephalus microplus]|uniref:Uncharacterized protein n=1 Tax=Rhipicephalus microplus TaxID=6941 RepID=A0A9J6DPM8_RHIMP|nr:hypothetical protein HPB51_020653 [Rhipicephalus microplus]